MKTATKPAKPLMTIKAFLDKYVHTSGYELAAGKLVMCPLPGNQHGEIMMNIGIIIGAYVKQQKIGRMMGGDAFVKISREPATVRGPDAHFISYKRLPQSKPTPKGALDVMPELLFEIKSPTDRYSKISAKCQEYLNAGVDVVVIIDPDTESFRVFRYDEFPQIFHNGDTVTFPDVLPGFAAPVKAFFE